MMRTTSVLLAGLLAASRAAANTMQFQSTDSTSRTIYFTPSENQAQIQSIQLAGGASQTVNFPQGWIGNAWSVSDGAPNPGKGMLAEVTFQGDGGKTFYDVSAIVLADDVNGVHLMAPASLAGQLGSVSSMDKGSYSGCVTFPCDNAYTFADAVQTKVTTETDIVVTLGTNGSGGGGAASSAGASYPAATSASSGGYGQSAPQPTQTGSGYTSSGGSSGSSGGSSGSSGGSSGSSGGSSGGYQSSGDDSGSSSGSNGSSGGYQSSGSSDGSDGSEGGSQGSPTPYQGVLPAGFGQPTSTASASYTEATGSSGGHHHHGGSDYPSDSGSGSYGRRAARRSPRRYERTARRDVHFRA